jgi:SAM-dependent methyltransferase
MLVAFLERRFTPRTVYMEIGAADCSFALRAAGYVERVYAIDVSGRFLQSVLAPLNLRLVLCDGVRIPVAESSVDIAWSGDFMEHLHPDDACAHLENVRRALVPGGEYFCETASPRVARRRMLAAGFGSVRIPFLSPRRPVRVPAIK